MTATLRIRIEELEEEIRQLKAAFAPKVAFPLSWKLDAREAAILSALFHCKGSFVTSEAILLLIAGFDEDVGEHDVRTWVGRLRRNVEPRGVAIITRARQGYQLDPAGRAAIATALGLETTAQPADPGPRLPFHNEYSEGEDAIIRAGYLRNAALPVIRGDLIAAGFKARSLKGLVSRAHLNGLGAADRGRARWSAAEDEILRDAFVAGHRAPEIRRLLAKSDYHRNLCAIVNRWKTLGLTRPRPDAWTAAEDTIIRAGLAAGDTFEAIRRSLAGAGFERCYSSVARRGGRLNNSRGTSGRAARSEATMPAQHMAGAR